MTLFCSTKCILHACTLCMTCRRETYTGHWRQRSVHLESSRDHIFPNWFRRRLQSNNHRGISHRKWRIYNRKFQDVRSRILWQRWTAGLRQLRGWNTVRDPSGVGQWTSGRRCSRQWRHNSDVGIVRLWRHTYSGKFLDTPCTYNKHQNNDFFKSPKSVF